jgi:hypothetical protein
VDLHDALNQIAEIRHRSEASGEFRGYRSLPVAVAGLLAIFAATLQKIILPDPAEHPLRFSLYWTGIAILAAAPSAIRIYLRDWREAHSVGRRLTRLALAQFLPCLAVGALITIAIVRHSPEFAWALPGLWQLTYSLGIFASCRFLPQGLIWCGMIFLISGAWNLSYGRGDLAMNPWLMGGPFGAGQLAIAALLYRQEERSRARDSTPPS